MSSLKERVNVVINSKKRRLPNTETSSNFTYSLNRDITRITDIIIKAVQMPYTFYGVNSLNNVVTFNNNAAFITIEPGNYTSTTMSIELKSKIDLALGGTSTVVTFNNVTYKFTITRGSAFILDGAPTVPASTAAKILGFSVSSPSASTIISDSVVSLSGPNYVNIISTFLTKTIHHKVIYADSSYEGVLFTIPLNGGPGDIITVGEQPTLPVRLSYKAKILSTDIIDIILKDDDNVIINLNGSDFSMELVFITE
jgi:hypothetical protein